MLFALLVFAALGYYFTTREERALFARKTVTFLSRGLDLFALFRLRPGDPFYAGLRERARWPLVTFLLVAVNVAVMLAMLFGPAPLGDPETLVEWGASVGPRTTNGERWRLVTALFVHASVLHLLVNVAALVQLGFIVERTVGRMTFATVYITAGVLGAVASVAASPLAVSAGATCAIFGIYGLLLASFLRGMLHRSAIAIPMRALKTLAPAAVAFVVYYLAVEGTSTMAKIGLCTGFTGGVVLTRQVADGVVRLRRVAALTTATAVILFMAVMAVRVVADVRPDIAAVVALEERTMAAYDVAVARFQKGVVTPGALAQLIEQTIVPDLEKARARVDGLTNVASVHEPLVADAGEFLRLRQESWRLRAEALRRANMRNLREADRTEHASLLVLEKVRSAVFSTALQ